MGDSIDEGAGERDGTNVDGKIDGKLLLEGEMVFSVYGVGMMLGIRDVLDGNGDALGARGIAGFLVGLGVESDEAGEKVAGKIVVREGSGDEPGEETSGLSDGEGDGEERGEGTGSAVIHCRAGGGVTETS